MVNSRKKKLRCGFPIIFLLVITLGGVVYAEDYEYDDNGRVVSVKHDDGSVTSYEYDKNGNIISVVTDENNTKESQEESTDTINESGADIVDSSAIESESNSNYSFGKKENVELNDIKNNSSKSVTPKNLLSRTLDNIRTGDGHVLLYSFLLMIVSLLGILSIIIHKRKSK